MPRFRPVKNILLFYTVVLVITVCASVATIYLNTTVFQKMEHQIRLTLLDQQVREREQAVADIEHQLIMESDKTVELAKVLGLLKDDQDVLELIRRHVQKEMEEGKTVVGAVYLDRIGNIRGVFPETFKGVTPTSILRDIFAFTSEKMGPTTGQIFELEGTGLVISIAHPVRRDISYRKETVSSGDQWGADTYLREMTGVLTVFLSVEELVNRVLIGIDPHFIVDNTGVISPYGTTIPREKIPLYKGTEGHALDNIARNLFKGFTGVEKTSLAGVPHLVFFSPVRFLSGEINNRGSLFTRDQHFLLGIGLLHRADILDITGKARDDINLAVLMFTLAITGFLGLSVFTVRRHLLEKKRNYEAQLAAVNSTAGSAAHHISQPLTAINGYVKILEIQCETLPLEDSKNVVELAQKIQSASGKIREIVESMEKLNEYRTEDYYNGLKITVFETREDKEPHTQEKYLSPDTVE